MTDRFVAVGTGSGKVAISDDGATWALQSAGFSGRVRALAYGQVWLACNSSNVGWSNDGETWNLSAAPNDAINAFAWGNDLWVAVDDYGHVWTSATGVAWTERSTDLTIDWVELFDVCWDPYHSQFVAVGTDFSGAESVSVVLTSPNGIDWTTQAPVDDVIQVLSVTSDGAGTLVAAYDPGISSDQKILRSTDAGSTWLPVGTPFGSTDWARDIVWGNDQFVAVGESSIIATSPDGETWTDQPNDLGVTLLGVTYGMGLYAACGNAGTIGTSPDGEDWTDQDSGFGSTGVFHVEFGTTSDFAPSFTFFADAVLRKTQASSFSADAEVTADHLVHADAVLRATQSHSFSADAAIAFSITDDQTGRNPHDRGEQHFGNMPATVVAYNVFSTVETQLRGLWDRIMAYETRVGGLTSFTVDSIVRKTHTATFNINAAFAAFTPGGSWLMDAIVRRTQAFSATANAITKRVQSSSGTLDAVLKRTTSGSLTADGVLKSIRTGSFTIDGYVLVAGVSTFTENAVLLRTQAGSLAADAIMKVARAGSFVTDAVIAIGRAGSATANAVVKKTISGTFTADATIVGGRNPDAGIGRVSAEAIELWAANHTASPTTPTGAGVSQEVIELWTAMLGAAYATEDVLELWSAISGKARVSQEVLELWAATHTASPTTPTGAGVSQEVLEVWTAETGPVRVTQEIIEIWTQEE